MFDTVKVNTVIIGGGHCGINLALNMQEAGKTDYIILERYQLFDQWRTKRWDSFVMNTPLEFSRLHGQDNRGLEWSAMDRPLEDDIAWWLEHVEKKALKYRERTAVTSVEKEGDVFITTIESAERGPKRYLSKNVVIASGLHANPKTPHFGDIPATVKCLHSQNYKNTSQLNEGAVLIVGGSKTGIQLSQMLNKEGRKVFLCVSKIGGTIRSHRGDDLFYWMQRLGLNDLTPEEARSKYPEDIAEGLIYGQPAATGSRGPISHHSLHRSGVTILGGLSSVDGDTVHIKENRLACLQKGLNSYNGFVPLIEEWVAAHPEMKFPPATPEAEWEPAPELMKDNGPSSLSLADNNITSIIFATGHTPDFAFLKVDGARNRFGKKNFQPGIDTDVEGLFYSGFAFSHHLQSQSVVGFDRDHAILVKMLL